MDEKLIFNDISLDDKELIEIYLKRTKATSYEYTFTSLYLWRNLSHIKYTILYDTLILLKYEENKGYFFMIPCGYTPNNLESIVKKLYNFKNSNHSLSYLFGDTENFFINDLKAYTNYDFILTKDSNDCDYIYLTNDLITLKGSKYHSKRNHCYNFKSRYNYVIKNINSQEIIDDCLYLLNNWHQYNDISTEELNIETTSIIDLLSNISLLNLKSIAIYVENNLAGFAIGEIFNNTAIIQVERCDIKYKGIYAFINNEFLIKDFSNTTYVNREEDCGCEGLIKAKKSYHPLYLLDKYLINIKEENE